MRYFELIKSIKEVSLKHNLVNEVAEGDIYEWLNSKQHKYPCVVLTTNNISTTSDVNTLNANLFYVDRLTDNDDNKLKIQSLGITVLQQILNKLDGHIFGWNSTTYTPFTEKFTDLCAGVYVTFNIEYEAESLCDDGVFVPKTLSITKNGKYDVTGYDKAEVNVLPKSDSITITKDGTYLPKDYGVDAFNKVEVDVMPEWVTISAVHIPALTDNNICTGIIVDSPNYEFEIKSSLDVLGLNTDFFGSQVGGSATSITGVYKDAYFKYSNQRSWTVVGNVFTTGAVYVIKLNKSGATINDAFYPAKDSDTSYDGSEVTLYFNKITKESYPHTFYYFKAWKDGKLISHIVPQTLDGFFRLYDLVTKKVIYIL